MSKDEIQELVMGVALVALGYALYKHFRPGAATKTTGGAQQSGTVIWEEGTPDYQSYAPYNSNSIAGQLAIQKILDGAI